MGRGWLVSLLDGAPQRPLPASPLAGMAKASAADCAAALLAGWRAQVPDCTEVQPRRDVIEYEESGERLQLAALSSPRLRDEQVVVEWISDDAAWGNGALWITFPGMTLATGEIERAAEWAALNARLAEWAASRQELGTFKILAEAAVRAAPRRGRGVDMHGGPMSSG